MKRILCILASGALLSGCVSTSDGPGSSHAKAKTSQLREGMSKGQVRNIFGSPDKVEEDDGDYHHHGAYIPYYGWHHGHSDGPETKWTYHNPKLEVVFRRSSDGWVVKEWDN